MPDRWHETRVWKVLRPAISIQVFLVSLCLLSKCWDGSPVSKLSLHASHVALPKYILISERLHVCCIRVINLCHRVPTQLQLNKYYYYYYNMYTKSPCAGWISGIWTNMPCSLFISQRQPTAFSWSL